MEPEYLSSAQSGRGVIAGNVAGLVALLAVSAMLAWPVGFACHGVWWLFMDGWNVIG